jgi:hypothetical protein
VSDVSIYMCGGTPSPEALKEIEDFALYLKLSGRFAAKREAELTQLRADLAALVPAALVGVEKWDDWQDVRESQGFARQADDDETAAARAVLARNAEVPRGPV